MSSTRSIAAAATVTVAAAAFSLLVPAFASAAADTTTPTGSVSGVGSPASGPLDLLLSASDSGWGLASAEASLDGVSAFVRLGSGACPEHPSPGAPEPPPGSCPASVSAVPLSLDTRAVADGERPLRVKVTDGAGNTATLVDREIVVRNAPPAASGPIATATVGIGGEGVGEQLGGGRPPEPPGNGPGRCRRPKLRMRLAAKPLWHTHPHHVPVLRFHRRYPYRGRLTCLVSGRRVSAPKGTAVGVYYRVWHRSFKRPRGRVKYVRKRTIRVRKKGRLKVKLSFRSGRTLLFRYRASDGETAKAKLRIAIPPRTRKPPWGPR